MASAAKMLTGKELKDGWKVIKRIPKREGIDSGSHFSVAYIIENEKGHKAFLKAVDFSSALKAEDPAKMLELVTRAFNYERDILEICRGARLTRVVSPIGYGVTSVEEADGPPVVQYLIFELADGDLRNHINNGKLLNEAWKLRVLHHVSVGMAQLHQRRITHQDLKPSNVLIFDANRSSGGESKVADLGRSVSESIEAPHSGAVIAGDKSYAPPELLYRFVHPDEVVRRYGTDAYLMGSLLCYLYLNVPMTPLLMRYLNEEHRPNKWGGKYQDVLPFIRSAYCLAIEEFSSQVDERIRPELCKSLKELCEPDPELRGHPRDKIGVGNPYSLRRYTSLFNLLARKLEFFSR